MARPKIHIDEFQLEKCAEKQWTIAEIAAFFKVSRDTIERRYTALIHECYARGAAKLRDLQWKRALEGSDRMIIHLGRHYLGQHDKVDIDAKVRSGFVRIDKVEGGVTVGTREIRKEEPK